MKKFCVSFILINIIMVYPAIAQNIAEQQLPLDWPPTPPDDYKSLVELRQKVQAYKMGLENELNRFKEDRKFYRSESSIDTNIKRYKDKISEKTAKIEALKSKKPLHEGEYSELKFYQTDLEFYNDSIEELQTQKEEIKELDKKINETVKKLVPVYSYLAPIDQKLSHLLNIEQDRNIFRRTISIAFCFLVLFVIVGFYAVAIIKEKIAESIFFGEKGIQFVAIFLIVIAIILFGIMGILESKELSALLGGLSGYILGRVSRQSTDKSELQTTR